MRAFLLALPLALALAACGESEASKPLAGGSGSSGAPAKAAEPAKAAAPKHPWAGFKPGSFAKLKTTSVTEVAGTKSENVSEMKTTLLEVTSDKVVVEMEMTVAGNALPKSKQEFPLKAEGTAGAEGPKPKTGSEDVEVAGKKFKCTWTEIETEQGGNKTVSKVWQNQDVPGHTVKMTSKTSGSMSMTMTQELVEYAAK